MTTEYSTVYAIAADIVERGWTQHAYARDDDEINCKIGSEKAVSWCLSGALLLTFDRLCEDLPMFTWHLLSNYLGLSVSIANWNDNPDRTQKDVVKLLREAAKRADREGMMI